MMFVFLNNRMLHGRKRGSDHVIVIPVALSLLTSVLSTGRTYLMYQIIAFSVIACVVSYRRNGWSERDNLKLVGGGILAGSIFASAFLLLGEIRGSVGANGGEERDLLQTASLYLGGSIAALNQYVTSAREATLSPMGMDHLFGENTLFGMYSFLRTFGYNIPTLEVPLEMTHFKHGVYTNVYTPLRRYLQDFGFFGVYACMFATGLIYGRLLRAVQRSSHALPAVIFAALYYPLVEIAIEERLFMDVLTSGTLYLTIYICVVYYLIVRREDPMAGVGAYPIGELRRRGVCGSKS